MGAAGAQARRDDDAAVRALVLLEQVEAGRAIELEVRGLTEGAVG